jgi:hypothetical protein
MEGLMLRIRSGILSTWRRSHIPMQEVKADAFGAVGEIVEVALDGVADGLS